MTTPKAEKAAKNNGVCRRNQCIKRAGDQKKPSAQNSAKKLYFSFWKIVLFFLAIIPISKDKVSVKEHLPSRRDTKSGNIAFTDITASFWET